MSETAAPSISRQQRRLQHKEEVKRQRREIANPAPADPTSERPGVATQRVGMKRDPVTVPGQRFAVLSWVAPSATPQRCKTIAVKIRGVFDTEEAANEHAKKLYARDPDFDIHIVDMYEWLVLPPPLDHQYAIPMQYQQEKLNKIMSGYYKQTEDGRRKVERRCQQKVDEGRRAVEAYRREQGIAPDPNAPIPHVLNPDLPERFPMDLSKKPGDTNILQAAVMNAITESAAKSGVAADAELTSTVCKELSGETPSAFVEFLGDKTGIVRSDVPLSEKEQREMVEKALRERATVDTGCQ